MKQQHQQSWTWSDDEVGIPCTLMRGGTSKGLFFKSEDLPPPGSERDAILKALVGSEDILQIDGLGGSRLVTAKLAIVGKSSHANADVDYTYGIVPPGLGKVVYTSNCGNISSGVGPFAIESGLVEITDPITTVRIHNTNTGKILTAHVPVRGNRARIQGTFEIPGVPGSGAEIFMDYSATSGAKTGKALPTSNVVDEITLDDGRVFKTTLGDVANPCVFLKAADLNVQGSSLPDQINANQTLLTTLKELRGKAAVIFGFCKDWHDAEQASPALPLIILLDTPNDYVTSEGEQISASQMDLQARFIFYNKCHESMAGTGSMCIAAMSAIEGTLVHQTATHRNTDSLRIAHPLGVMEVVVKARDGNVPDKVSFERLGFGRTARKLMQGTAYIPSNTLNRSSTT